MKIFSLFVLLLFLSFSHMFPETQKSEFEFSADPVTLNTRMTVINDTLWFSQPEHGKLLKISAGKTESFKFPVSSEFVVYPETNRIYYLHQGKLFKTEIRKSSSPELIKLSKQYFSARKFGKDCMILSNPDEFKTAIFSVNENTVVSESILSDQSYPLNNDLFADIVMSDFNKLGIVNIYDSDKKFINEFASFQFEKNLISNLDILFVDEDFRITIAVFGSGISKITLYGQNGENLQETELDLPFDKMVCYCFNPENNSFYYLTNQESKYSAYKISL